MVKRSLHFLWADMQNQKSVQEMNKCLQPNIYALKSQKKQRRLPIFDKRKLRRQAIQ